ncbi:MAG: hypothetical protein KKA62_02825 [Nanoarchaeota archaeon]|nr:hypothetical protein [Nanoarchaeota archaeon]MBU1644215.1 hypothetical protein [Nanoarchaeota archaeon]MBU1976865.1 hypothetical protein [Nanoarchaeota archaeon]
MSSKRGQGGPAGGAAVLIAIIAVLIVGFVILIPPQERAKLLEDSSVSSSAGQSQVIGGAVIEKNLLKESPGRIDYLSQREVEHPLPVVNIYTKTEAKVLAEKNVVYVKKSLFSEEGSKFTFEIPDLENTNSPLLNFEIVGENKGKLIINLNDEELFNAEVQAGSKTVKIPKNLLKEQNVVTFAVSSPGAAFWSTNEVSLEKIKFIADVTSVEAQQSKNVFLVSETEKKNLQKAVLKFQPSCEMDEVGKLTILANNRLIYSGVPDCDLAMVPIEFSPENVYQGENEILFQTDRGSYLLSHVLIESKLKEVEYPTYYFDLSYEEYKAVTDGKLRLRLIISFVDVVARKYGNLGYNGHIKYFDTKEMSETMDLSDDVVQGANALKIQPMKTLEIREIRVDLVK